MPRTLPLLAMLFIAAPIAHADNTASLDGWPDWVRTQMDTEKRRVKYRDVTTPDDSVRTRLPGKSVQPQAIEDGWYFSTEIDSDVTLECYLFTSGRDLATLTDVIAEANLDAMGAQYGTVGNRRVFHTDAGEIAGMPYLALEWLYTVESDAQLLVGFTKVRAAGKGETAFACANNTIGYRETFSKAFTEFVVNTETNTSQPTPFYEEIARIDMSGIGPAIIYSAYSTDEDGDIRLELSEASIIPVDPSTIMTSDSITVSYSKPGGDLISSHSVSVENGEISSNMTLRRNEAGAWVSGGTLQGKELEFEIDGTLEPVGEWQQLAVTRDLFTGEEPQTSILVWLPEADPTQFTEATMARDDADVERQAKLTLGPINVTGRFDEFGNMIDADMAIGPISMTIQRIWSQGSLEQ